MSDTKEMVERNLIYKCIHGSTAYGLNTPTSDIDVKGIFIPDMPFYFGMRTIEQQEYGKDEVIYALKKFVQLARDCNPNIIEVLFVDNHDLKFINYYGKELRRCRDLFQSRKAKFTFSGYAFAQLKRIKGHQKWINNPQEEPKSENYFTDKVRQTSQGPQKYSHFQEHEYDAALKKWQQYKDWVVNRNAQRSELEHKFGYDTKHAMHLIRLLRMGKEILTGKGVIVKRPDREELLAIRNGAWTYEKLIDYAESLEAELNALYEKSPLPHSPNDKEIDKLLIDITQDYFTDDDSYKKNCVKWIQENATQF